MSGSSPSAGDPPPTTPAADAEVHEHAGFALPTWYVVLCAGPFAAAFLIPMLLIYQRQNAVPPVSSTAAAWTGVIAGWVLWGIGAGFWLLGKVALAGPRRETPQVAQWWDHMTRNWVLVVLLWGVVATLAVLVVGAIIDHAAA